MPGVNIGNGAIIASRSVVTNTVAPYSIVGGNTAKIIKMRFDDTIIDKLQQIAWWNWPIEIITENLTKIINNKIEDLDDIYKNLRNSS